MKKGYWDSPYFRDRIGNYAIIFSTLGGTVIRGNPIFSDLQQARQKLEHFARGPFEEIFPIADTWIEQYKGKDDWEVI